MTTEITGHIDPEDMPLCPLCDQPIMSYEPTGEVCCLDTKAALTSFSLNRPTA